MDNKKKAQKAANKAFIDKIKSLGINTGKHKSKQSPACPDCGGQFIPVGVVGILRPPQPETPRKGDDEVSLSA